MTKGQIAMSAEQICSVSEQMTMRQVAAVSQVRATRIAVATTVLQFAPELAGEVMAGVLPLDDAYATATRRKKETSGTEVSYGQSIRRMSLVPRDTETMAWME